VRNLLPVAVVVAFAGPALGQTQGSANVLRLDKKAERPKATVADVAWLAGHWTGEGLGGACEEWWSPPAAGSVMGVFRFMKADKVVFYEILTVVEDGGSLVMRLKHFHGDLKGWEEKDKAVDFPLVKLTPTEAFFDGLTYRKLPDGSLRAYVLIRRKDGTVKEEGFHFRRAAEAK
jgi:hypothetical protein